MVYTLVCRCFCICSNWTQIHTELAFLKEIFCKNDYPVNFIDKAILLKKTYQQWIKVFVSNPSILRNNIFAN